MPIDYLRRLSGHERTPQANRHLGLSLALVAGAANAGGFLAVQQYTSHMTGIVSSMADHIALGNFTLALAGLVSIACFLLGAMVSALLVNWGRDNGLRSQYALPLLLEAALLMVFGIVGSHLQQQVTLYVSLTVLLLCFMMGLQNAIITKVSHAEIRTTHVTGLITDIGIELGRMLYWRGHPVAPETAAFNRQRLGTHAALVLMFFAGGVIGATGFQRMGFQAVLPLAFFLLVLSLVPVLDDLRHGRVRE
jgi:uncharacterized membrane protein YoaK (UPF0700 family)